MKTPLLDRAARRGRTLLVAACAAVLAACGPGTGGTGTGPVQGVLTFSSAAAAPPNPGAACPHGCDAAALRLEDARIEFGGACRRFVYEGGWDIGAAGEVLLDGTVETTTAAGTTREAGTLQLVFSDRDLARAEVTATLRSAGQAVLGPVTVARSDEAAAAAPPACPSP